jgi:hypothetical protein
VFYEAGYAHARGKLCLLLTTKADDIRSLPVQKVWRPKSFR